MFFFLKYWMNIKPEIKSFIVLDIFFPSNIVHILLVYSVFLHSKMTRNYCYRVHSEVDVVWGLSLKNELLHLFFFFKAAKTGCLWKFSASKAVWSSCMGKSSLSSSCLWHCMRGNDYLAAPLEPSLQLPSQLHSSHSGVALYQGVSESRAGRDSAVHGAETFLCLIFAAQTLQSFCPGQALWVFHLRFRMVERMQARHPPGAHSHL